MKQTHRLIGRVRRPVRRGNVERYLRLTLLSFAASVAGTRLLLELTGYPQLGNSELHIAHVLWGGLLLFVAALLPLIYANRWVYDLEAVLAGVGVGLFIDEVGKFITQSNDYFYPAAAPIIYVFFLLTVWVYLRVRQTKRPDARAQLYEAFESMQEVLDHDLEPQELSQLRATLDHILDESSGTAYAELAAQFQQFLQSPELSLIPDRQSWFERALDQLQAVEARLITELRHRAMLIGGLSALGAYSIARAIRLLVGLAASEPLERELSELFIAGRIGGSTGLTLFSTEVALEGSVGVLLIMAALLLVIGREQPAVGLAQVALLLSLAVVNLLTFYFQQFSTILTAALQFGLLLGVVRYRRRFLLNPDRQH